MAKVDIPYFDWEPTGFAENLRSGLVYSLLAGSFIRYLCHYSAALTVQELEEEVLEAKEKREEPPEVKSLEEYYNGYRIFFTFWGSVGMLGVGLALYLTNFEDSADTFGRTLGHIIGFNTSLYFPLKPFAKLRDKFHKLYN